MKRARLGVLGTTLVAVGALLIGIGATLGDGGFTGWGGMMGGYPGGMVGGGGMMGGQPRVATGPGPGEVGFVAGTTDTPRVIGVAATAGLRFVPDTIRVQEGETIRFEVTVMGPTPHEFMVGPAADVVEHKEGTPEVPELGMMETGSVTYTFTGSGPFAFACHVSGHYEAGMKGTIVVVN